MDIIELLNEDIFNIISEINKYQFNILTNKSRLDDLIVVDTRFSIIETCKNLIPYLIKKNDETFYVPLDGGEKIYLFNIDIDKSSENNYYITDTILVNTVEESVDYNEYGLPDKKLYNVTSSWNKHTIHWMKAMRTCSARRTKKQAMRLFSRLNSLLPTVTMISTTITETMALISPTT